MLGEKIDSMHQDVNKKFDTLDEKYGKISETMILFLNKMDEH